MKVFEANTLLSEATDRAKEYKELRTQMVNLRKALKSVADLDDSEFSGKGASNIKAFYHDHVGVTDQWIDYIDMKIAFLTASPEPPKTKTSQTHTSKNPSWSTNWQMPIKIEIHHVRTEKAMKDILNDIDNILPLDLFQQKPSKTSWPMPTTNAKNTGKIGRLGRRPEDRIRPVRTKRTIHQVRLPKAPRSNGQRKNATPIHYNAKAYRESDIHKKKGDIEKRTDAYLKIKKEEAKEREIKDLKKKLADGVSDPDEYLEIAKKIGYENLEPYQQQYVIQLETAKQEAKILKGIGEGLYNFGKTLLLV